MPPPLRDHPLARGKLADRSNAFLARAWDRGWLPPPDLDPQALWAIAERAHGDDVEAAGRSDEDVADFRERLERICASVQQEADLNALGQAMAWGQLSRVVNNRLAFGKLWKARPELLDTRLAPPIIVLGHMRSGTTRIHKLLAADPAHSHTRYQDAFHPIPSIPGMNRTKSAIELAMLGALNPWMQSIHPMAPAAPFRGFQMAFRLWFLPECSSRSTACLRWCFLLRHLRIHFWQRPCECARIPSIPFFECCLLE